jgi:hypothetical protein
MYDVDRSGERFDRWPLQPVPQEVQQSHGHAPIHDPGAKPFGRACIRAVAPRARECRDLIVVRRCVCPDNFVHVLADAGARAQRRTVVNENVHGSMR